MTSYIFNVSPATIPYAFNPTLDGNVYSATVWYNSQDNRPYITISDLSGNVIFTVAMVESPIGYDISITYGYFASTLVWQPDNGLIVVTP